MLLNNAQKRCTVSDIEKIEVEVLFAYPNKHFLKKITLDAPTSVQNVILQSGILEKYTEIDLRTNKVGIFSRPVKLTDMVENCDRIEIYRPLIADPKEIRRKRAAEQNKK
ncbi:RnfH family protein [Actinobacillus pleuropneumoniae]|uniref:RnfH family protein n=1 Tax=Actinobacillus pleuropneumoniae TaxID=715 RepID=UPI003F7CCA99